MRVLLALGAPSRTCFVSYAYEDPEGNQRTGYDRFHAAHFAALSLHTRAVAALRAVPVGARLAGLADCSGPALVEACRREDATALRLLLDCGAWPGREVTDGHGDTALREACGRGSAALAGLILDHCASKDAEDALLQVQEMLRRTWAPSIAALLKERDGRTRLP